MQWLCNMTWTLACVTTPKKYGENKCKCKNTADKRMVKAMEAVSKDDHQTGHAIARNIADKGKWRLSIQNT